MFCFPRGGTFSSCFSLGQRRARLFPGEHLALSGENSGVCGRGEEEQAEARDAASNLQSTGQRLTRPQILTRRIPASGGCLKSADGIQAILRFLNIWPQPAVPKALTFPSVVLSSPFIGPVTTRLASALHGQCGHTIPGCINASPSVPASRSPSTVPPPRS